MIRRRISYSGRVQGVGFRYTTAQLAVDRPITGWVRNEPDGTVSLEAQGEADELLGFLRSVREHFRDHIPSEAALDLPPLDTEQAFEIRGR